MKIMFIKSILLFFILCSNAYSNSKIELTKSEQQWLASNKTVNFTGDPNWLPYEAFNIKGDYIGIVAEHLELISEKSGLTFNIIVSKSWTESTEKAKNGSVDVLSETDDSNLKSHLNFTTPYLSNPIVITMRNTQNYVETLDDIKDKKIALIKDYGYAAKIRKKYPNILFVTVNNIQDGLISVSTEKVDALLCTLALCSYTISELGLNNVKIIGKTEFDTKLALGVQKNIPELLSILNKSIEKITPAEKQKILDSWIKNKFVNSFNNKLVYQVMAATAFIILIFIFWIRRLSKEISLRVKTEKELMLSEEKIRISYQRLKLYREHTSLAVIEWNLKFEFIDINPSAERIFGYTKDEVLGCHVTDKILPESVRPIVDKVWGDLLKNKGGTFSINENITKDGKTIICEWHNTPLVDIDGNVIGVTSLVDDVTDREKQQENFRQTQKMDAIGNLTGGIAHDFNNMLGVILGFSEILKEQMINEKSSNVEFCDQILRAGDRAKQLTAKLLAFSHKDTYIEESCDLNELIRGMQNLLEKTLTHRISLIFDLAKKTDLIIVDKSGMEDTILNICINAMHAMPEGGEIRITTKNILDKDLVSSNYILPMPHVFFSIKDSGTGMDQETKENVFVPFYTTKGSKGTGLGMSQVYGFVKQSKGEIQIFSEIGKGTNVELSFPINKGNEVLENTDHSMKQENIKHGNATILVVDDEVGLLKVTKEILNNNGYDVFCAESAREALNILEKESVDLMLSDVIMPEMDGYELASRVQELYPSVKIQMVSGYVADENPESSNVLHKNRLRKPVTASILLKKIQSILK